MKTEHLIYIFLYLCLIHPQFTFVANANEECEGFGIETTQSQYPVGAKITKITTDCAADNVGLHVGDIVVSVNDISLKNESLDNLLAHMSPDSPYRLKVIGVNNNQQSNGDVQTSPLTNKTIPAEEPIYADTEEVGYDGLKWIKWLVFFVILSCTLTPVLLILGSNGKSLAIYLGVAATLGAADADRNPVKGALEGVKIAISIYYILLLLGPIGTIYCIYRPIFAAISEADKTYCCAMTWLGRSDIATKSISADGRWLAEVRETQNNYLGLGDKEFAQKDTLAIMDLETGQHVKWPQTADSLVGVNLEYGNISKVRVDNGIFVMPPNYLNEADTWYKLNFADDIVTPLNLDRVAPTPISFNLLNAEPKLQQVALQNIATNDITTIQSNLGFNGYYLSYDGRVLALVRANPKDKPTDGLVRQLAHMLGNYLFESWTIEFWDVVHNKKIATYSGHGVNSDAWNVSDEILELKGQTKFLESSQDGMLWYMIKSDGYIHVFDMRNKIPVAAHQ